MKNKGFTLIELLAVIVILAIVSLIAVPIIINIITNSKEESIKRSLEYYIDAVEQAIVKKNLKVEYSPSTCEILEDGNLFCDNYGDILEVKVNGTIPKEGNLVIIKGKVSNGTMLKLDSNNIYEVVNSKLVKRENYSIIEQPVLSGLTPVVYDGDNWIVADTSTQWYDYNSQNWANAVSLRNDVAKDIGDPVIVEGDNVEINGMFVWIPRFEYKYTNLGSSYAGGTTAYPGEIEINFLSKNTTTPSDSENYKIHPAFFWDENGNGVEDSGESKPGIWVGKFETTGTAEQPTILPNLNSLFNQTAYEQFTTAQLFNTSAVYGIINADSHMMKNSEWGAVAYLSQSKYGKYGNEDYSSTQKEVYINNSKYKTGRSGGAPGGSVSSTTYGTYTYDGYLLSSSKKTEIRDMLKVSSTTGNITGIYDMSGGAWELVMGVYINSGVSWGAAKFTNYAKFPSEPLAKYYDKYTTDNMSTACDSGTCYGQGLSETTSWYNDRNNSVSPSLPWVFRGNDNAGGKYSGIFATSDSHGDARDYVTFRVAITVEE